MMTEQMSSNAINSSVPNQYYGGNPGIYTPPTNCHYTQLSTQGVAEDIMKISIGKNGKVFKAITQQANVNYIWYNKQNHHVEIWGPENNLADAYNRVFDRIQRIITKVVNGEIKLSNNQSESNNVDVDNDVVME